MTRRPCATAVCLLFVISLVGCASTTPVDPASIPLPPSISGNTGKYMCPWTSDDVVAPWVEKGRLASAAAGIGSALGKEAGMRALEAVPFVGSWLGGKAGRAIGRKIAVQMAGGWDYIRETSDVSFDSFDDMSVYIYVKYSKTEHYRDVLKVARGIYPEFDDRYPRAVNKAINKARKGNA